MERDARQVSEIRNLSGFRTFVRLCAGRVGQLLNLHGLGNDAGVSYTTAREWLSVLEASYLAFVLPPLHANISKRLIKSPKLYFFDVGLASYLLGIGNKNQIFTHPLKGALLENLVVVEALKHRYNRGLRRSPGRSRDQGRSHGPKQLLRRLSETLSEPLCARMLVYGGDQEFSREGVIVTNHRGFASRLLQVEEDLQASDA